MNLVYRHASGGRLWQGNNVDATSVRELDACKIKLVVLAADHFQPKLPRHIDVARIKLDDDFNMGQRERLLTAHGARQVAKLVADRIRRGQDVLVTCWAGWNRSGLCTALTLLELLDCDADSAIRMVRKARGPNALGNPVFRSIIAIDCATRRVRNLAV